MGDYRQQQIEALAMVADYSDKLIPAMEEVAEELTGEMKEDTEAYLLQIIDAFNFVIETFNVTRDLVNENEVLINEDALESQIGKFSDAMIAKDFKKAGVVIKGGIIDFLKVYNLRAKELVG